MGSRLVPGHGNANHIVANIMRGKFAFVHYEYEEDSHTLFLGMLAVVLALLAFCIRNGL